MCGWHHFVVASPDDQRRDLNGGELARDVIEDRAFSIGGAQQADGVAAYRMSRQQRSQPLPDGAIAPFGQPAEADGKTPDGFEAELLHERTEEHRWKAPGEEQRLSGEAWRNIVERFAGHEHEPCNARVAGGDDELSECSSSVIANENDVVEIEFCVNSATCFESDGSPVP
jgi:hypothetical protein